MKIKWNNSYSDWMECYVDSVEEMKALKAQIRAARDDANERMNAADNQDDTNYWHSIRQIYNNIKCDLTQPMKMLRNYESGGNVVAKNSPTWTLDDLFEAEKKLGRC
jgi:DNA-binding protein H-NS